MTLESFQNHGWKATDKVVYKEGVHKIVMLDFSARLRPISIKYNEMYRWLKISEIELYQPIHEAHTSLLTKLD